jgi:hypothetical protein
VIVRLPADSGSIQSVEFEIRARGTVSGLSRVDTIGVGTVSRRTTPVNPFSLFRVILRGFSALAWDTSVSALTEMLKLGLEDRKLGRIDSPATTEAEAMTPTRRIHNGIFLDSALRISFLHNNTDGLDVN